MGLLEFHSISKRFFGVRALDRVSLSVESGEIHALCGANGAGKSTLMKILVGVHPPDSGAIRLEGEPTTIRGPAHARSLGIDIVYQEIELPPNLTVAEAVYLGREPRRRGLVDYGEMFRQTAAILRRLEVPLRPDCPIEELSVAEKQLVQITRALAAQTRLLVLDEPTSALTDHEAERLFGLLEALRTGGTTTLYVSHKLEEIFRLADRISVLRDGSLVGTFLRQELDAESLVRHMVGEGAASAPRDDAPAASAAPPGETLLEVRALERAGAFRDISFRLRGGEVLGMFGIVGAGRTEVARSLFGLDRPDGGEMLVRGRPVRFRGPGEAVRAGLALVPEDRKLQGLVLEMSLQRNASLPSLPRLRRWGRVDLPAETRLAAGVVRDLEVAAAGLEQDARQLSGGNQQKVVIGKWLAARPSVLILDEPTKGIDVAAKREVHAIIRRLAREGVGVLLISSEMEEVLSLADRLLVLHAGRIAAELDPRTAGREQVLRFAVS